MAAANHQCDCSRKFLSSGKGRSHGRLRTLKQQGSECDVGGEHNAAARKAFRHIVLHSSRLKESGPISGAQAFNISFTPDYIPFRNHFNRIGTIVMITIYACQLRSKSFLKVVCNDFIFTVNFNDVATCHK